MHTYEIRCEDRVVPFTGDLQTAIQEAKSLMQLLGAYKAFVYLEGNLKAEVTPL